jgi:outer membrane protein
MGEFMDRMLLNIVCALACIYGSSSLYALSANNKLTNIDSITPEKFIEILLAYHPFFQAEKMRQPISDLTVKSALAGEDWYVNLSSNYNYLDQDKSLTSQLNTRESFSIGSSLSRKFFATGGKLNLGYQLSKNDQQATSSFASFMPYSSYYATRTYVEYVQPLLSNFGGFLDRLPHKIAVLEKDIEALSSKEAQENFLLTQVNLLYDRFLYQQQDELLRARLDLATQQLQIVKQKYDVGLIDEVDFITQQSVVVQTRLNFMHNQQVLNRLTIQINSLLPQFKHVSSVVLQDEQINFQSITVNKKILANSRQLKILSLSKDILKLLEGSYRDKQQNQLNLSATVAMSGDAVGIEDALSKQSPEYSLGLEYHFSVENTENNLAILKVALEIEQINFKYQDAKTNLHSEIAATSAQLDALVQIINLHKENINIAAEQAIAENKRFNLSYGDLSLVIQARDKELAAKLQYIQSLVTFKKTYQAILSMRDKLL